MVDSTATVNRLGEESIYSLERQKYICSALKEPPLFGDPPLHRGTPPLHCGTKPPPTPRDPPPYTAGSPPPYYTAESTPLHRGIYPPTLRIPPPPLHCGIPPPLHRGIPPHFCVFIFYFLRCYLGKAFRAGIRGSKENEKIFF